MVPALGHVDKLYVLRREATRLTDGHDAAMMVLHQEEHECGPQLMQVIPDPDHDAVFLDAVLQTRGAQGGQP